MDNELCFAAGEWAVIAMACTAFADGVVKESELEKAEVLVTTNRLIVDSLGEEHGRKLFNDVVDYLREDPGERVGSYMDRLTDLAWSISEEAERNSLFGIVLAMATADREILPEEYKLMERLKEMLGATVLIPLPMVHSGEKER